MSNPSSLADFDFFTARCSPRETRLFVRYPQGKATGESRIQGEIYGPFCANAETLPARFTLRDAGPGESLLGQALILDPVYWTPELPAIYRVRVQVETQGKPAAEVTHEFGLRWFDLHNRSFYLQNRRMILRGGVVREPFAFDASWSQVFLVVKRLPTIAELRQATGAGVMLAVSLSGSAETQLQETLRQLAQFTAVTLVILPAEASVTAAHCQAVPNLLFAVRVADRQQVPLWADVVIAEVDSPTEFASRWQQESRPIIALGRGNITSAETIRASCDRLRGELAIAGQYAGYIVHDETSGAQS